MNSRKTNRIVHFTQFLLSTIASCLLAFGAYGQVDSVVFTPTPIKESTTAQFLTNYYTQDGIHSAVTGGKGSEDLRVVAQNIIVHLVPDHLKWYDLELGVDLISSASTDSIDFNVSSASRKDGRVHVKFGYGRNLKNNWKASITGSGSVESDYLSTGLGFSLEKIFNSMQSMSIQGQVYFDDVRWGWYQEGRGVKLIYPEELRGTEWFDEYKRNTYSISAKWNQVVNQSIQFAVTSDLVYQSGLLSTPFHRVYFNNQSTPNVEMLPTNRLKIPVALQLNYQTPLDMAIRTYYRFYTDDYGIVAHTAKLESPIQFHINWSVLPFYRFHTQRASTYFKPFREHNNTDRYYTSDYDFSKFTSQEFGVGLRYRMIAQHKMNRQGVLSINQIELRYGHYTRSDNLTADFISLLLNFAKP